MSIVTPAWVKDAVFYQVFPDRFARSGRVEAPGSLEAWDSPPTVHGFKGGDLYGVADRLDDLADLGVTAIYLNPIFSSASNHRYHTYDYLEVDPLLGGNEALRELLDAAHARGMRVILDGVFNHASRGFWPFNHVPRVRAARRRTSTGSTSTARASRAAVPCAPTPTSRCARRPMAGTGATGSGRRPRSRSATAHGRTCRPCPSSTPTTRRSAST